ncbi:uncharacterized protein [Vulpes vulpes]|uniref:Uncharacterized protein isoform X2 n=1 Tax=Vulpes vulpes TaxID=9627 RepID=A0ABM4ZT36_VULVU
MPVIASRGSATSEAESPFAQTSNKPSCLLHLPVWGLSLWGVHRDMLAPVSQGPTFGGSSGIRDAPRLNPKTAPSPDSTGVKRRPLASSPLSSCLRFRQEREGELEDVWTSQPTWDACQQLLQTLLTTEERQRVYLEAWKSVPGADGRPTQLPDGIEDVFPLVRLTWDCDTATGQAKGAPDYPAPDLETLGSCLPPRRCNRPTPVPDR